MEHPNLPVAINNVEDDETPEMTEYLAGEMDRWANYNAEGEVYKPFRNKPGKPGGGDVFVECSGRNAAEAKAGGFDLLEFEGKSLMVTNFSQVLHNFGSVTNPFLFKVGSQPAETRTKVAPLALKEWQAAWNADRLKEGPWGKKSEGGNGWMWGHGETEFAYSKTRDLVFGTLHERQNEHPLIYGPTRAFVDAVCDPAQLERVMELKPYREFTKEMHVFVSKHPQSDLGVPVRPFRWLSPPGQLNLRYSPLPVQSDQKFRLNTFLRHFQNGIKKCPEYLIAHKNVSHRQECDVSEILKEKR
jgi:hypothetical protein